MNDHLTQAEIDYFEAMLRVIGIGQPKPRHAPVTWPWQLQPAHLVSAPIAKPGEF